MLKAYEHTHNRLHVPQSRRKSCTTCGGGGDEYVATGSDIEIKRYNILANGAAFCLRNFLSHEECENIIEQAERIGLEDCGYSRRIRKTDRVAAHSLELAQMMMERVKPFVGPFDLKTTKGPDWYPEGIPHSMPPYKWYPTEINPTFRICRYERGCFFFPHHDGGYCKDDSHQSIQTFMIYLNDDFDGGTTRFYNQLQHHYKKPDPNNLIYSYIPRKGDALVFNSQITHDGEILSSGQKYILRSEIMYSPLDENVKHEGNLPQPDHIPNAEISWP
mmetsp:Transcript_32492/g.55359  ORF Transcript_32492/g.55359 Transcript_32492/m.55359 type:complete len:275 (+) Transcript_32492:135-959(+)|eukprot:CAMPEP_0183704102 /NCGR_PEP_ID=MMETSP0737-20130205/1558_1 /TAXON_ID=385413 /ORGANISM="Thalassiosira miniscula, Strain CCMP1093" /LENGTH=274 /DNA_ID=CAMNT_0025930919 /DNA_START=90 /DNA_END=914 /DNA_ORIENTATION=+